MGLTRPRAYQIYDIDYKQAVRVITTTNISISGGAPSTVDGVSLAVNDRILVSGQTVPSNNGIYQVSVVGSGSNGTWIRSTDTNATGELLSGTIVMVTEGTAYADTSWKLTTNDPITIGVTPLTWEINTGNAFGTITANGTSVIANSATGTVTFTSGNNFVMVGTGATDSISFAVSDSPNFSGTLNVTGNANLSNLGTSGQIISTGNVTGGNFITSGGGSFGSTVSATGNITGGNLISNARIDGANLYLNSLTTNRVLFTSTNGQLIDSQNFTFDGSIANIQGQLTVDNLNFNSDVITSTGNLLLQPSGVGPAGNVVVVKGDFGVNGNTILSSNANVVGNLDVAGRITSTNGGDLILNSFTGASEGAQIVLAWKGVTGITGQSNSTWNIDVDSSDNLRVFWQNAVGNTGVPLTISSATSNVTFGNNVSVTGNISAPNLVSTNTAGVNNFVITGNITGNLLPAANVTYNLGSPTQRWNEIFLAGNTIDIGGATISADLTTGSLILTGPDGAEFILTGNDADDALGAFGFVSVGNTEAATSITTGALTVAGGAGIVGNIYAGGIVDVVGNIYTSSGVDVAGNIYLGNLVLKDNGSNIFGLYAADGVTPATISQSSVDTTRISNGTSNVQVVASSANVSVSVGGIPNVAVFSASGANIDGTLGASGNITGSNVIAVGNVDATDVYATSNISAIGNVSASYFLGNIYYASGYSASKIYSGTTEANIGTPSGNIDISVGGTSNVLVIASSGATLSGTFTSSGNANVGNLGTNGSITANGNITGGNVIAVGNVNGNGGTIDGDFTVNGNLIASNLVAPSILTVTSPLLYLNEDNPYPYNFDIGFYSHFVGGPGNNYQHTGFVREDTSGIWKLFSNVAIEPTANLITFNANTVYDPIQTGNIYANGASDTTIIATGNISGNYLLGNGSALTGVYSFSNVGVTGGNTVTANSLTSTLTFEAGSGIVIVADPGTQTITVSTGGSGDSIFATGGDMELVTDVVTDTLDLGLVTEAITENNDLGGFFIEGFVGNDNFLVNSINGNILTTNAVITTTGNITAGNLITTGVASVTGNVTGGNITTAGVVTATGNVTGGNVNTSGRVVAGTQVFAGNGSLGSPSYAFSGDTDTGLFLLADGNLAVETNAGLRAVFNDSGANVFGVISATGNISGANITATGAVYSNYNTNTANTASFNAIGGNTKGGTGYLDFISVRNTSASSNPYKWLRTTSDGQLQVINSAYTTNIFNLTDAGDFSVPGTISVNYKQAVNGPAFSAYAAAILQTIPNDTQTKVLFQTEEYDTNSCYSSSRFTPNVEGYYQLNAEVRLDGASGTGEMMIILYKNGSEYKRGTNQRGTQIATNFWAMQVSSLAYANGTTDYFEIYVQQGSGGSVTVTAVNAPAITWFNGCMVRGA